MQTTEFVESYFDAWNHHDPAGVASHLTADGIYCDVRQNAQHNHGDLIRYLKQFFELYRHRYELKGDILSGGATVAFQYQVIPQHRPGNCDLARYQGAEFITLADDAATLIADYHDDSDNALARVVGDARTDIARARKYAKSGLSSESLQIYARKLDRVMRRDEAFMDPQLTLPLLAARVGCSVNYLSQVINESFGVSFFDYVNNFRVARAKRLLADLERQTAVLKVAYSVGFNSNSAFYTAFKKRVGVTPAGYRQQQVGRRKDAS